MEVYTRILLYMLDSERTALTRSAMSCFDCSKIWNIMGVESAVLCQGEKKRGKKRGKKREGEEEKGEVKVSKRREIQKAVSVVLDPLLA